MPKVKLGNISLYYEVHGRGVPLLLIAGLGSDVSSWLCVLKRLSSRFKVIVFDNCGCGRSSASHKKYSVSKFAEDAIKLLDHLKIERAHVLGHSMGGYIAQELAINYPSRVDKLILVSTASVSSNRNNILFKDIYRRLKEEGYSKEWFRRWVFLLFSNKLSKDKSFRDMFINNSMEYPYLQKPEGFKRQIEAITLFDTRNKIGAIKAKTLVIEGEHDILITPKESKTLAKRIPNSIFKLLNGAAHCMHIENPKLFTDMVIEFLNSKEEQ